MKVNYFNRSYPTALTLRRDEGKLLGTFSEVKFSKISEKVSKNILVYFGSSLK